MDTLVPFTFTTIIGTVAIYGIVSPWIFKVCSVQQEASEGVLFFGGERIAIEIGKLLKAEGFRVLFIDSIYTNIARIKAANLESCFGNILSDDIQENLDLEGLGKLLAFTPNDEANSLAAIEFKHIFGRKNVFQLPSSLTEGSRAGGRVFANKDLSLERLEELALVLRDIAPT